MKDHVICICHINLDVDGENGYEMRYKAQNRAAKIAQDYKLWGVRFSDEKKV